MGAESLRYLWCRHRWRDVSQSLGRWCLAPFAKRLGASRRRVYQSTRRGCVGITLARCLRSRNRPQPVPQSVDARYRMDFLGIPRRNLYGYARDREPGSQSARHPGAWSRRRAASKDVGWQRVASCSARVAEAWWWDVNGKQIVRDDLRAPQLTAYASVWVMGPRQPLHQWFSARFTTSSKPITPCIRTEVRIRLRERSRAAAILASRAIAYRSKGENHRRRIGNL